jgi:hypothetical protein
MSTLEPRQALHQYLAADAGVKAVVDARLFQRAAPANTQKPYLVIWPPISRVPVRDLAGVAYKQVRLQVTAVGETQTDAEKTANAVMSAVEGFKGNLAVAEGTLNVKQVVVDSDRQIDQPDVGEVEHHVDIIILY